MPKDLLSHNEIDMKPYKENEEEEEEEEEEENDKVDGETSDENTSNSDGESDESDESDSDSESNKKPSEKSAVSVSVEKSSEEESLKPFDSTASRDEMPTNPASEQELTTVELNSESCETPTNKQNKSWWKPLFGMGFVKGSKKNSKQEGESLGRNSTLSSEIDSGRYSKSTGDDSSLDGSSESSDSDSSELE